MVDRLNETHAIAGHVAFEAGDGGLLRAAVANAHASASVYLHGAHVTSFCPAGTGEVLWLSRNAVYRRGVAIRGGIPVCWPWFGPHPGDPSKPQHGFARNREWRVESTAALDGGATRVRLFLTSDDDTRALWPYEFEAMLTVTVGVTLTVALTCRNRGDEAFTCGGALHTYLAVADVTRAHIDGLDGRDYLDQLDGHARNTQHGPIEFEGNVDRIYLRSGGECTVHDPAGARIVRLASSGSDTTVVWNPWHDKAAAMADFPDDGYRRMVCVEAANAERDVRTVEPGGEHTLEQTISATARAVDVL